MTPSSNTSASGNHPAPLDPSRGGALEPRPTTTPTLLQPFNAPSSSAVTLLAKPNAMGLLKALRRRWMMALTVGMILAVGVGTTTWLLIPPPKHIARTQLFVASTKPTILFTDHDARSHQTFLQTQAYLIKDRFVLNAALRSPEVAELNIIKQQKDPVQWLESQISVSFPSQEFIQISISGDNSGEIAKLVMAVTQAYMDGVVNRERNERNAAMEKLKGVLQRYEERSKNNRTNLRKLQEAAGGIDQDNMAIFQKMAMDDLRIAKDDHAQISRELRKLQIELGMRPDWLEATWPRYTAVLTGLPIAGLSVNHALVGLLHDEAFVALASPAANTPTLNRELDQLIDKDAFIVEANQQIRRRQIEIDHMRAAFIPSRFESASKQKRQEIVDLKKQMADRREKLRPEILEHARERTHSAILDERNAKQAKYASLKKMEKVLLAEAERLDKETKTIRKSAVDLAQLQEDISRDEDMMRNAARRLDHMEVELEAPQRITQPSKEAILYTPDGTKKKFTMTAGAAAAALALVLLAFAWFEFQTRKIHTPEEVTDGLGLRLVGTVPDLAQRPWLGWLRPGSGGNSAYTQTLLTESVDAARTLVLHAARTEKLQIVMITSALAGEGKTSLASHLAASLARAGRRTLLVDSDLRNPTLHRLFELSRTPGLSELLRGDLDLDAVIRDTPIASLSMISAGQADAVALQTLALDAIPQLFKELRTRYDFIVVDSCPVLPVADSLLVGQHVDAVIFSLLREVSRLPRVYAACQRLSMLGVRLLGAVVNGAQDDMYATHYQYINPEDGE